MGNGLTRAGRRLTGRDLQRLFAATILLPGVLLTLIGLRAWHQDGELAQQRLRERVERATDQAQRAVEVELRSWVRVLSEAQHRWPPTLESLPDTLRRAMRVGGAAVLLRRASAQKLETWPDGQLAYRVTPPADVAASAPRDSLLAAAARAEWQDGDYARAATLYRRYAERTPLAHRPAARLQEARALRKAGRIKDARQTYEELASVSGSIGPLPVDLVANYEVAMLDAATGHAEQQTLLAFYQYLVQGRWSLEPSRYHFYSERARTALEAAGVRDPAAPWRSLEERKLQLADAARAVTLDESKTPANDAPVLLFRDVGAAEVTLLLSSRWLQQDVWPRMVAPTTAAGFDVTLRGAGGTVWHETRRPGAPAAPMQARRVLDVPGGDWQLTIAPRDPGALMSDVTRWRSLTLVMLLLVVALLASGTYLTARVVRRELEVARQQADFVSAVSHEFRSPLTGIRQLGEMLVRGRVPDETRRHEYYERITQESARLSRLVENLLQAAQIDEGRRPYRVERIDTTAWLRAVIEEARTQPALRHATIEAEIPARLPALTGDQQALSSALHNLIDNAVKYSPAATPVRVEAQGHDGRLAICVHDRGVGMSDDDRRHVFERFRRGCDPITRQVKGSGLGLSLVHDIVRAHGGQVECESRLGQGTTFRIRLAAAPDGV